MLRACKKREKLAEREGEREGKRERERERKSKGDGEIERGRERRRVLVSEGEKVSQMRFEHITFGSAPVMERYRPLLNIIYKVVLLLRT